MQVESVYQFDREKKTWEDEIGHVNKDDTGPRETKLVDFCSISC